MPELSFLNIKTSCSIAEKLEAEDPHFGALASLLAETSMYIDIIEQENLDTLQERNNTTIDANDTYQFFRSYERTRNTKFILQYLAAFILNLPMESDIEDDPANPFEQLKSFTLYNIELLKEKDVEEAIFREHERLKLLTETNSWYYKGQLEKSYKALLDSLRKARRISLDGYRQLFLVIQQLCTFWFSVRSQDIDRVRISDILAFKLTRYLLNIYKPAQ